MNEKYFIITRTLIQLIIAFASFTVLAKQMEPKPSLLNQALANIGKHYKVNLIYEDQTVTGKYISSETMVFSDNTVERLLTKVLSPLKLAWFKIGDENYAVYPASRQPNRVQQPGSANSTATTFADSLSRGTIKGYVLDEKKQAQGFATVSIMSTIDSVVISNVLSDTSGLYHFNGIKPGNYKIKASLMGYINGYSLPFTLNESSGLMVPAIVIKQSSKALKEVVITASRPVVEQKSDRFILNVANSPMASGNSLQLLKSAPFVNVSPDNEVTLQGKKTLILIDNRPVPGAALEDILRTLPADNIASLELITSPSSKYDASYGAVINILTKKNRIEGLTGTVRSEYSQGDFARENTTARLTFNHDNLTLFGSAGYNRFNFQTHDDTHRQLSSAGLPDLIHEQITRTFYQDLFNFQAGGNVDLGKTQNLGILFDGRTNRTNGTFESVDGLSKLNGSLDSILKTHSPFHNSPNGFDYNVNYHLLADSGKTELTAFTTLSPISRTLRQDFTSALLNGNAQQIGTPAPYQSTNSYTFLILVVQADFSRSLSKQWKLETGVKYQNTDSKQAIDFKTGPAGQLVTNPQNSSNNHITETILAGYGSLTKKWTADRFSLGLRLENSNNNYVNHYNIKQFDLFPSAAYTHDLNDQNNISVAYRRTIDRVPYDELVPYRLVINQYNINMGNPSLKPQYSDLFSINTKISGLTFSANYALNNGMLAQTPAIRDEVTKVTYFSYQNLGSSTDLFFDVYYSLQPAKWWNTENRGTLFGHSSASGEVLGQAFTVSSSRFAVRSNQTFTLSEKIKLEIDAYYNSSQSDGLTRSNGYGNIDAGLLISLLKDRGHLRLGGEDILKKNMYTTAQDFGVYSTYRNRYFDSQRGSLSLSYNFGQTKIKTPPRRLGNEDAVGRSN